MATSATAVKLFGVATTNANGQQTSDQTLVYGAGNCTLWLDPSDATTLIQSTVGSKITGVYDKTVSALFTYALASNPTLSVPTTPNYDITSLATTAIDLDAGFLWSTGNPVSHTPIQVDDGAGQFTLFYVLGFDNTSSSQQKSWLLCNNNDHASSNYPVGTPNLGGIVLTKTGLNTFTLTFYDPAAHTLTSSAFSVTGSNLLLSIVVGLNTSNYPTVTVRANGSVVWTYDAGTANSASLNFSTLKVTGLGAGAAATGIKASGEAIAYSGVLAASTILTLESYLSAKWQPITYSVVVGSLSSTLGTLGQSFTATLPITHAASVTLTTTALNVGTNWHATAPTDGSNTWTISGTFPTTYANFILNVSATDVSGTKTGSASFAMTTTLAGALTAEQQLILTPAPVVWLDPSQSTLTVVDSATGKLSYLRDRVTTSGFTLTSSETPIQDTTSLATAAIAFAKASESSSGFNYAVALDFATRPDLYVVDPSVFLTAGFSSSLPKGNGFTISNSSGYYTIFLVGRYNGKQAGTDFAEVLLKNDFPDTAVNARVQKWGVQAQILGSSEAVPYTTDDVYGNPDSLQTVTQIDPHADFVVTWRCGPSGPSMRLNGAAVSSTYATGSLANWHALNQKFTQICGSHALGPIGELIAYASNLSDSTVLAIETALKTKWFSVVGVAPTISQPSVATQYVSTTYHGTVTITNGGTGTVAATIAASAGSNWTITADATTAHLWNITGTMPAVAETVTLTITATQDGSSATKAVTLTAQALPTTPVIGDLAPLTAPITYTFVGLVTITNVHGANGASGLTISATAGSNWTIAADPAGTANSYQITGTMPSAVTYFNVTILALDVATDGTSSSSARTFVLGAVSEASIQTTQYALDLFGTNSANRISNEAHTLTADNGPNNQFLIPLLAPYYANTLVVQTLGAGNIWVNATPAVDYEPVCQLQGLSQATSSPVYSALSILNLKITGTIRLTYQTLGGNLVVDRQLLLEQLAARIVNQKQSDWSNVVNLPSFYPVGSHIHNVETDVVQLGRWVTALQAIGSGFLSQTQASDVAQISNHIANKLNPHRVTPGQIGLPYLLNYPPASASQAVDATNNSAYLTPYAASLSAPAFLAPATDTVAGKVQLNLGSTAGDATNATDALTAGGLIALMSGTSNALKTAFSGGDQFANLSPFPLSFPLYWQGVLQTSLADLLNAIQTAVGIEPLPYNSTTGTLTFPPGVTVPSLVTTSSNTSSSSRDFTVNDACTLPLTIPT